MHAGKSIKRGIMKKIILMLAVVAGGFSPLMAEDLGGVRAFAGSALSLDVAGIIKDAGVLPDPAAKPVEPAAEGPAAGVFEGKAVWTGVRGAKALIQLGIRKSAEEDAVAKCQAKGLMGCRAIGSMTTDCDSAGCTATATALSLVPVSGVFTVSKWKLAEGFGPVALLGVRKSAEDEAVFKCQAQGYLGCFAIGSTLDECNDYSCRATGMAQAHTYPR